MKMTEFSFKREAMWMMVFPAALGIIGLLILLFVILFGRR
jgi:hypothetical protein